MDIKFNSLNELYERLIPALTCKVNELRREKMTYIKKEDIWNYLKDSKWLHANYLTLADMVDDILNCNNYEIDKYVKDRVKSETREAYFDNLDNLL
jgi:hypothetical protein